MNGEDLRLELLHRLGLNSTDIGDTLSFYADVLEIAGSEDATEILLADTTEHLMNHPVHLVNLEHEIIEAITISSVAQLRELCPDMQFFKDETGFRFGTRDMPMDDLYHSANFFKVFPDLQKQAEEQKLIMRDTGKWLGFSTDADMDMIQKHVTVFEQALHEAGLTDSEVEELHYSFKQDIKSRGFTSDDMKKLEPIYQTEFLLGIYSEIALDMLYYRLNDEMGLHIPVDYKGAQFLIDGKEYHSGEITAAIEKYSKQSHKKNVVERD